jgi:HlyD family secretion protein
MSITTSTPPTPRPSTKRPEPQAAGSPPPTATRLRRAISGRAKLGLAALGVLGVIVVLTVALRWWMGPSTADTQTTYTVTRRNFAVTVLEKGELSAVQSVDVRCEVEGRSTIIWLIPEGTEVKKGDLLVELASDEIAERIRDEEVKEANAAAKLEAAQKEYEIQLDQNASDIRKAELAVHNAEIELEKYVEGDWEQQKTDAQLDVERAKERFDQAQKTLEDSQELFKREFITELELQDDKFDLLEADIALKKAKLAQIILNKYTHPQDLTQKQSDVEEARKDLERVRKSAAAKAAQKKADLDAREAELGIIRERLDKYREQKKKTRIVAPADGLVVYYTEPHRWGDGDEIKEGVEVRERQNLITLPDTSVMKVKLRVHESLATSIREGLPATVHVEGVENHVFTGRVTKVAALADSQNRWLNPDLKEYATEITLDPTDVELKPGVTARAEIHIEDVTDALVVPVQCVFSKGRKQYVFRGEGDDAEPVEVQVGSSSREFAQIKKGLQEGDEVLLAVSDELKRKLPEPEATSAEQTPAPIAGSGGPGAGANPRRPAGRPGAASHRTPAGADAAAQPRGPRQGHGASPRTRGRPGGDSSRMPGRAGSGRHQRGEATGPSPSDRKPTPSNQKPTPSNQKPAPPARTE